MGRSGSVPTNVARNREASYAEPSFCVGLAPCPSLGLTPFKNTCRHAGDYTIIGEGATHHGVGADDAMIAKPGAGLNFCAGTDKTIIADARAFDINRLLKSRNPNFGVFVVNIGNEYSVHDCSALSDLKSAGKCNMTILLKTASIADTDARAVPLVSIDVHRFDADARPDEYFLAKLDEFGCPEQGALNDAAAPAGLQSSGMDQTREQPPP